METGPRQPHCKALLEVEQAESIPLWAGERLRNVYKSVHPLIKQNILLRKNKLAIHGTRLGLLSKSLYTIKHNCLRVLRANYQ